MNLETVLYEVDANVATITLNRPDVLNAFNQRMCDEFTYVWNRVRLDDEVHVVVLRAAGERAFCTGVDRKDGLVKPDNIWSQGDPGNQLGPKSNHVFKPVVMAVNGMCAGGAFYWLNESDIVICGDDATFFDPHVTYGMTSAFEPMGLARRIPYGEVARWALMGLDERMSAQRAHGIGLVSEVTSPGRLWERARELADKIASKPPPAVQGTLKAIWEGVEMSREQAKMVGLMYTQLGNPLSKTDLGSVPRPEWELR